jgi:fatty acid desaturase
MSFYLPFLALTAVLSRLAHLFMYVLHYCSHQSSTDNLAINRYVKPANVTHVASLKHTVYQTGGTEKGGLQ